MEKQLTSVGNSVAVILDRALCRMFDLRRGSSVRVTTDGERIVIEPLGVHKQVTPRVRAPAPPTIAQIVATLVMDSIPTEAIARLHPGIKSPRPHAMLIGWADRVGDNPSHEDQLIAQRLRVCFDHFRGCARWDAAVEAALSSC